MDLDDEEPPELIQADGDGGPLEAITSEVDDLQISKVPITIISGKSDIIGYIGPFWQTN